MTLRRRREEAVLSPPSSSFSLEMKPRLYVQELRKRRDVQSYMLRLGSTCIADQLNPSSKLRDRLRARLYRPFNEAEINRR